MFDYNGLDSRLYGSVLWYVMFSCDVIIEITNVELELFSIIDMHLLTR